MLNPGIPFFILYFCLGIILPGAFSNADSLCDCARRFKPVCGSDNITYDNKCLLECAARNERNLTVVYRGTCCPKNICPPSRNLVCDNLGHTHVNECILQHVRCIARKIRNRLIHKEHDGPCTAAEAKKENCDKICVPFGGPVCDHSGRTYENECLFEKFNCNQREKNASEAFLAYYGTCATAKLEAQPDYHNNLRKVSSSEVNSTDSGDEEPSQRLGEQEQTANLLLNEDILDINKTISDFGENSEILIEAENNGTSADALFPTPTLLEKPDLLKHSEANMLVTSNRIRVSKEDSAEDSEIQKPHQELTADRDGHGENLEMDRRKQSGAHTFLGSSSSDHEELARRMGPIIISSRTGSRGILFSFSNRMEKRTKFVLSARKSVQEPLPDTNGTGRTLSSSKNLHVMERCQNDNCTIMHFDPTQPCSAAECDKTWNPVCDARNETHKNPCLFKFYACKVYRTDGTTLELAHEGECVFEQACGKCPPTEKRVPVCDNQNQTHSSLCAISQFNCLQRKRNLDERVLVHVGHCHQRSIIFNLQEEECPQPCSADNNPVCDEAMVTHRNLCIFQQKNCHVRKSGRRAPMLRYLHACPSSDEEVSDQSPEIMDNSGRETAGNTVSDNRKNASLQRKNGAKKAEDLFECPIPSCSESSGLPVCDSEGNLHENICMFTYARCLAAKNGTFLSITSDDRCAQSHCSEVCADDKKPVCGSDFETYINLCTIQKKRCENKDLEVLFVGNCSECLKEPCPRLASDAPDHSFVCDEESTTRTVCEYQMLSCIVERNYGLNLAIQHLGRCCDAVDTCSHLPDDVICASDQRSYQNKCHFDIENCRNQKLDVPTITIKHTGECSRLSNTDISESDESSDEPQGLTENSSSESIDRSDEVSEKEEQGGSTGNSKSSPDECQEKCENLYNPVCGTDDITYLNRCELRVARCELSLEIGIAYEGKCCDMQCDSNFNPVCDSQGITHQNLCFFGRERCIVERTTGRNITIDRFDVCSTGDSCNLDCQQNYEPICGTEGTTFINECEMDEQNCFVQNNITSGELISKEYDGECCKKRDCDNVFLPVCDSDGVTHANDCIFSYASCLFNRKFGSNLTIEYKGQCCNQPCQDEYKPVCDGEVTHENLCRFKIAQCESERRGELLSLAYPGECCRRPTGQCQKTGDVCDSDGQTHTDLCEFQRHKCMTMAVQHKNLTIIHAGECCTIEVCHSGLAPVCDSRGGTHATLCHFKNTKCIHDKIHPNNTIQLAYEGECCSRKCGHEWFPVCDQHGGIYRNKCHFKQKSCEQQRKFGGILMETPCPQRRDTRSPPSTSSFHII